MIKLHRDDGTDILWAKKYIYVVMFFLVQVPLASGMFGLIVWHSIDAAILCLISFMINMIIVVIYDKVIFSSYNHYLNQKINVEGMGI
jgi:hypothetical protein